MPSVRLRNRPAQRPGRPSITACSDVCPIWLAVGLAEWVRYGSLPEDMSPRSALHGFFQLLDWKSLGRLTTLSRSARLAAPALCRLLHYHVREARLWRSPAHCGVCLAGLWDTSTNSVYESGACVVCSNTCICRSCEYTVPAWAVGNLGVTRFKWDWHTRTFDESAIQAGDRLCLQCSSEGADADQRCARTLYVAHCNLADMHERSGRWAEQRRART